MHSLVYSKKDRGYTYKLPVDENGVLTLTFGKFGWGPQILRTPYQKLTYLMTDHYYDGDDCDQSPEDLIEDTLNDDWVKRLIESIKTRCPEVKDVKIALLNSSWYPRGYVDYQSYGTSHGVSPTELIFSNNIIILIDNDNSCHFSDYRTRYNYVTGKEEEPVANIEDLFGGSN